ncbi:MAG: ribosome biogenesis GTPase Der [Magnetococcus sp. DMHC-6]
MPSNSKSNSFHDGAAPPLLIALVGRPNVGKSTLFNCLTKGRDALVDDMPGVTRDRLYGRVVWQGRPCRVVDTGGFVFSAEESMDDLIRQQVLVAVEEADLVVFVVDGKSGPLSDDFQMAHLLRRSGKPVVVAVNKTEGRLGDSSILEFHELGMPKLMGIASAHGQGISNLLEYIYSCFPVLESEPGVVVSGLEAVLSVAIIGRPNVGKSTLVNQLLGEERVVATDLPGTTRGCVDIPLVTPAGDHFLLVDTAGIRAKSKMSHRVEKFSVILALKAIDRAQVAVLILDATLGVAEQDLRVANHALEAGCGLVIAINKWDMMPQGKQAQKEFTHHVLESFPRFQHAPLVFLSARNGRGVGALLPAVKKVWDSCQQRISTNQLNRWLKEAQEQCAPPRDGGRTVKLRYVTQVGATPPTLLFFTNGSTNVAVSYRRYLENRLRDSFGFAGTPLHFIFREGENPYRPD